MLVFSLISFMSMVESSQEHLWATVGTHRRKRQVRSRKYRRPWRCVYGELRQGRCGSVSYCQRRQSRSQSQAWTLCIWSNSGGEPVSTRDKKIVLFVVPRSCSKALYLPLFLGLVPRPCSEVFYLGLVPDPCCYALYLSLVPETCS